MTNQQELMIVVGTPAAALEPILDAISAAGGGIINATASIGDGQNGTPSSSRSQVGVGVGIITKF